MHIFCEVKETDTSSSGKKEVNFCGESSKIF